MGGGGQQASLTFYEGSIRVPKKIVTQGGGGKEGWKEGVLLNNRRGREERYTPQE